MKYKIKRRPPGTSYKIGEEIEIEEKDLDWFLKGNYIIPATAKKETATVRAPESR